MEALLRYTNSIHFVLNTFENSSLEGKTAIDIGCGGGILTESLASVAANVHGIDMAEKGLAVANIHKNKSKLTNIKYSQSTVEDYALKSNEKFDVLTCMEMLEHVPSPGETIQACSDIVIDGGDLFLQQSTEISSLISWQLLEQNTYSIYFQRELMNLIVL